MAKNTKKKNRINAKYYKQIAQTTQGALGDELEKIAKDTQFIKRVRNFNASQWIQAAAVTFINKPTATMENFAEQREKITSRPITEQGVSARFQEDETRTFLVKRVELAMGKCVDIPVHMQNIAELFPRIYVGDCSTFALPDRVHKLYPGCGNQYSKEKAAMKCFCRYEFVILLYCTPA